jgi:hypothetical protein
MSSQSDPQKSSPPLGERTCIALLFIFFFIMALPMFRTELMLGHDIPHSFYKEISLYQAWSSGDLLGRWIPDVAFAYGYPLFNFYAPLFSWMAVAGAFILRNYVLGFNAAFALSLFLSGLTMYYFAKKFWGPAGALVSAIAYLYAPYHILDIYVRGACAEALSFVFFPLVLLMVYRIHSEDKPQNLVGGSLAVAGLCLSHNFMGVLGLALAFSFAVFLHFTEEQKRSGKLLQNLLIFTWGVALATFFWLPALAEKQFIQLPRIVAGSNDFKKHFIPFLKLFFSPWGFLAKDMSFEIGPAHLLLATTTLFLAIKNASRRPALWRHTIFWTLVTVLSVFFMLHVSTFAWRFLRLNNFMNLPWRFLAFVTCAVSFLAGGTLFFCPERLKKACLVIAITSLVALNIGHCHPIGFKKISIPDRREFLRRENPGDSMENLPMWVPNVRRLFEPVPEKLSLLMGRAAILSHKTRNDLEHVYRLQGATPALLFFHTFYFPGWKIYIDREETDFRIHLKTGAFIFMAPQGEHEVVVRFEDTPVRIIANSISVLSVVILAIFVLFLRRRRESPRPDPSLKR